MMKQTTTYEKAFTTMEDALEFARRHSVLVGPCPAVHITPFEIAQSLDGTRIISWDVEVTGTEHSDD